MRRMEIQDRMTEGRALETYQLLLRAAGATSGRLQRGVISDEGLTETQYGVLESLLETGPLSQGELGRRLLKSSGNITVVVDNLEKRALVVRERNPQDRRSVTVSLTEDGRRLIKTVFPRHLEAVVGEMGALTPEEQEELGRLCRKLT